MSSSINEFDIDADLCLICILFTQLFLPSHFQTYPLPHISSNWHELVCLMNASLLLNTADVIILIHKTVDCKLVRRKIKEIRKHGETFKFLFSILSKNMINAVAMPTDLNLLTKVLLLSNSQGWMSDVS